MTDAVSSTSTATAQLNTGRTRLAENFETFLTLLTTQLKNQDPLSPLDSNEFTAQLTQMTGVEQQLLTNDLLQKLVDRDGGLTSAVDYVGREVTAAWSSAALKNGGVDWSYELGRDASAVTLQVLDGQGRTVWTGDAPVRKEGLHPFRWDGKDATGRQLSDGGVYTLKVVAKDAGKADVPAQVLTRGRVTGVETYDGSPYLSVGTSKLPLTSVISVDDPAAAEADEPEPAPQQAAA